MQSKRKVQLGIAGLAAAALAGIGVVTATGIAQAETPSASPSASPGTGTPNAGGGPGRGAPHQHTTVTGAEADKVIAAVKAKSGATITSVQKDPDGSYDAMGTKDAQQVAYDVSADLQTVTERTGGPGRGGGGRGGASQDTPVTGAEADKVIAAVKAKDGGVSITEVRKDPDGSYDALGTKNGSDVFYDVSADLGTVTLHTR